MTLHSFKLSLNRTRRIFRYVFEHQYWRTSIRKSVRTPRPYARSWHGRPSSDDDDDDANDDADDADDAGSNGRTTGWLWMRRLRWRLSAYARRMPTMSGLRLLTQSTFSRGDSPGESFLF